MSNRAFLIFILLALSAVFSCSETALFSLSRSEVAKFKASKSKFAKNIIEALSRPRQLLVSILLGNELINVSIAIMMTGIMYELLDDVSWQAKILASVLVSTPLIVVLGEVIPKNIGIRFASSLAPICALFIRSTAYFLSPIRKVILKLADSAVKIFGGRPEEIRSMIVEEEFRQMVELGLDEGNIAEGESELIHHVFDMADVTVEQIMTPKEGIFAIALNSDIESAMREIRTTKFSRIPVYDTGPDDIVGILHVRDLFSVMRRRKVAKVRDVENIIRPAYFAPLREKIEQILKDFQKMKVHMAIIIDEKRKPAGVVTMEDIFGALFEGDQ